MVSDPVTMRSHHFSQACKTEVRNESVRLQDRTREEKYDTIWKKQSKIRDFSLRNQKSPALVNRIELS